MCVTHVDTTQTIRRTRVEERQCRCVARSHKFDQFFVSRRRASCGAGVWRNGEVKFNCMLTFERSVSVLYDNRSVAGGCIPYKHASRTMQIQIAQKSDEFRKGFLAISVRELVFSFGLWYSLVVCVRVCVYETVRELYNYFNQVIVQA